MPPMISWRATAPWPCGQITETSYPACTSVVASFQTRRSNGTGRFSTIIRTRLGRDGSPTDAIVLSVEAIVILDANQIDNELVMPYPGSDAAELRIAVSNHNDLAERKCFFEGFYQQGRDVGDHT